MMANPWDVVGPKWFRSERIHLRGSWLVLEPQFASSLWYVYDARRPLKALTDALPLKDAKKAAERLQAKGARGSWLGARRRAR